MNGSGKQFTGVWLPMVTPLRDGEIDLDAACALATRYREAGIDGLVLFGSTGEGSLIGVAEKIRMVNAIREDRRALPIVLGAGGIDTRAVAATVRRLDGLDIAGFLVPPPCYLRPSAEGIVWHYQQIAAHTSRPLILYNVPGRTGVMMDIPTLDTLSQDSRFAAVKECDPANLQVLRGHPRLSVLCGEDTVASEHLACGGDGVMPVTAHLRPEPYVIAWQLARAGRPEAARALLDPLRPLSRLLFTEPSPAPVKKALAMRGWIADELRLPMMPASDELAARLHQVLERLPAPNLPCTGSRLDTTLDRDAMAS